MVGRRVGRLRVGEVILVKCEDCALCEGRSTWALDPTLGEAQVARLTQCCTSCGHTLAPHELGLARSYLPAGLQVALSAPSGSPLAKAQALIEAQRAGQVDGVDFSRALSRILGTAPGV